MSSSVWLSVRKVIVSIKWDGSLTFSQFFGHYCSQKKLTMNLERCNSSRLRSFAPDQATWIETWVVFEFAVLFVSCISVVTRNTSKLIWMPKVLTLCSPLLPHGYSYTVAQFQIFAPLPPARKSKAPAWNCFNCFEIFYRHHHHYHFYFRLYVLGP